MAIDERECIFEEMTKKAMIIVLKDGEVYLACEDHPDRLLQERFDDGYLECVACGWRITLRQARMLVNDALAGISALFDLLDEEIMQKDSKLLEKAA